MDSQKSITKFPMDNLIAPELEQSVCIRCGFCCDGTLFQHAHLNEGERGALPVEIEKASFSEGGRGYFRLPCRYFSGKCTIYDRQRAYVCGSYRCQLLKDLSDGMVTSEVAHETVLRAHEIRRGIISDFRRLTRSNKRLYFRQVLTELGKLQKSSAVNQLTGEFMNILIARCNIFEALLIRHFRSADDFEKLIMK